MYLGASLPRMFTWSRIGSINCTFECDLSASPVLGLGSGDGILTERSAGRAWWFGRALFGILPQAPYDDPGRDVNDWESSRVGVER